MIDGHGHPLFREPWAVVTDDFLNLFSEGRPGAMADHVGHTTFLRRACRDLARRLGCEATVDAVLEARRRVGPAVAARALSESRVAALLIDTGYPPEAMSVAEMRALLPCEIHEIFRIETCAQDLLAEGLPYRGFVDAFRAALRAAAEHCVGFKSIIAYRSGLAIQAPEPGPPASAYRRAAQRVRAGGSPRLTDKPLLDALFFVALEVARDTGRPLQLHCGFGDPDIDLLRSNPLHLRPIVDDPRWAGVRLVLLHMAYPYFREAAFMTAVYPEVYLDLSLALPFLGPGVTGPLIEALSLAPTSKLLYGSDVRGIPELFALSADWGRAALGEALTWLIARNGLTEEEGREVARQILSSNAGALYRVRSA